MGSLEPHDPDVGCRIVQPPVGICENTFNHGCHWRRSNPHGTCNNSENHHNPCKHSMFAQLEKWVPTEPDWGWHSGIEGWEGQSHGDRKQDSPISAQRSMENNPCKHSMFAQLEKWVPTEPDWGWHSGIEGWEGQSHGDRKQDSPISAQRSMENRPSQHSFSHENPKRCLNLSWLHSQVIAVISLSVSNSCIRGQATSFLTIFAQKTQVSLWTRSLSILQSVILIPTMLIPATIHVQSVNLTGVCYLFSILK